VSFARTGLKRVLAENSSLNLEPPDMSRRRYRWCLAAIVLIGILGRLLHLEVPASADEEMYLAAAKLLSQPNGPPTPHVFETRILWSWTLNVWGKLTSLSVHSSFKLMLLFSIASILLAAAISKRMFGQLAGLFTAGIVSFYYINVVTDARTFPDGMAIPMLLASTLLFLNYRQSNQRWQLIGCALLTGLLLPTKEYFILVAGAYLFSLWFDKRPGQAPRARLIDIGVLLGVFAVGASSSLLLHYLHSGNPLGQFQDLDFGERELKFIYFDKDLSPVGMLLDRLSYVRFLFTENGITGGILLLGGGIFLAANWRRREDCRLLFNAALIFVLFLTFMPMKIKPLLFVVAQSRYMLVFTPFLAVGAGGLLSTLLARLETDKALRAIAWTTLIICAVLNLWLPNYRYGDRPPSVLTAINECVDRQDQYGFKELILPWQMWQWAVISEYDSRRHFLLADRGESKARSEYGDIDKLLADHTTAAVFVPPSMMQDKNIRPLVCNGDFRSEPIMLPNSSVNSWFTRLGHPRGLTVAGYLFVRQKH
jgi:hypothetical protein